MNLRYRIRLARQALWRNRRFLWRTFEALIALFCLLATHQAVWVYFKGLSERLREEFPNPAVWLIPINVAAADTITAGEAMREVNHSPINFQAYAPPRSEVVLKVNNVEHGRLASPHGRPQFFGVPLRRGENHIRGVLEEEAGTANASLVFEDEGLQRIYYRPRSQLATQILGAAMTRAGEIVVLGVADPTAKLHARVASDERSYPLFHDKYGVFLERLTARPSMPTPFYVGAAPENEAAFVPSDSIALVDSLLKAPRARLTRNVTLVLDGDRFKLHGLATVRLNTAWAEFAAQKLITPEDLLADYFGLALSCFNPFLSTSPEITASLETASDTVRLTVEGKIPPTGLKAIFTQSSLINETPLLFGEDRMALEVYEPVRLRRVARADYNYPTLAAKGHAYVWKAQRRGAYAGEILFESEPLPKPKVTPAPKDSTQAAAATGQQPEPKNASGNNVVEQIKGLEALAPRKVRDILTALLKAAPFLWLLWILGKEEKPKHRDYRATLYAATMAFFLFHFILLCLPVFSTSFSFIDPVLPLFEASDAVIVTVKDLGQIYPFLAIGVIFLFRPLYYTYKLRLPPPTLGRRVQRQFLRLFVFWPAVLLLPTALFYLLIKVREAGVPNAGAPPLFAGYLLTAALFAGIGLLCCWIFLYWLLAVGLGQPIRMRTAIKVSWAMLLLPLLPILAEALARFIRHTSVRDWGLYPFFLPPRMDNAVWFLMIVIVGTALFHQFVELAIRLSHSRRGLAFLRSRWMWALLPIFILLSLPMNYVLGAAEHAVDLVDLNALAGGIASLLPAALLIGLIMFLRNTNPQDRFELRAEALGVGTILFAYYLTGRNTSLLFAPVLLFVGWLVFTRWALVERVLVTAPESAFALQDLVRKLLAYKQARQLSASLRRNLEKKYAQGELTLAELHAKMKDGEAHVEDTKKALPENEKKVKRQIFGHGPEEGPWANAATALRYGLLLSLPFQANTFMNLIKRQSFENFPLLQVANALVSSLTTWFLIAFVFGYFFHKIRGGDGFSKAFAFAAALLVATIPLRLIDAQPLLEQGFVVQIVQILAYVLLLALLAFDLRTLQKLGFTWRDLLTVHGFTTITAYGSSIALATLASLSGPQWFSFVGKFLNLLFGEQTMP